MTTLKPRADAWKPVLAAMEEDHPTGEAAAKEVVKVAYGSLAAREWFLLLVRQEGRPTAAYGPYSTPNEAEKAAALIGGPFRYEVVEIAGAGMLNANTKGNVDLPGYCKTKGCGHARWEHLIGERNTRGKCARPECPCSTKKFKE